ARSDSGRTDVREMQAPDLRGALVDRAGAAIPHVGLLAVGPAEVEGVHRQGAQDVVHDDVGDAQVLHQAAAVPAGLDADPAVGALEHAAADHDIAHVPAHLAADDHAAVTAHHGAADDGDVLEGDTLRGALGAGLERDAVVAHIDVAVADAHVT